MCEGRWRWGPVSKQTVSIQKVRVMRRTCTSAVGAWERGVKTLFPLAVLSLLTLWKRSRQMKVVEEKSSRSNHEREWLSLREQPPFVVECAEIEQ